MDGSSRVDSFKIGTLVKMVEVSFGELNLFEGLAFSKKILKIKIND